MGVKFTRDADRTHAPGGRARLFAAGHRRPAPPRNGMQGRQWVVYGLVAAAFAVALGAELATRALAYRGQPVERGAAQVLAVEADAPARLQLALPRAEGEAVAVWSSVPPGQTLPEPGARVAVLYQFNRWGSGARVLEWGALAP